MTSFRTLRAKLMKKIVEWPECRKHEPAMEFQGKTLTWWQLAVQLIKEKKISKVKALVRRAEEAGLI